MASPQTETQPLPLIAGQSCPLCGGEGHVFGIRDGYPIRECRCVGSSLLSWQWESEAAYHALYTNGRYHQDCVVAEGQPGQQDSRHRDDEYCRAAQSRLEFLEIMAPAPLDILDIGCGTGAFIAEARGCGYAAAGLEPDQSMVDWARSRGRNVACGTWEDVVDTCGIITLHDVFEHLTRPEECLERLKFCLAPDGLLVIEIPEWGCPESKSLGLSWRHIKPLQHIWLPDETAARAMFERAGFEVVAIIRPRRGTLGKVSLYLQ
jgi:SAM-dependent methyltransferase